MNSKYTGIAIALIAILVVGGGLFAISGDDSSTETNSTETMLASEATDEVVDDTPGEAPEDGELSDEDIEVETEEGAEPEEPEPATEVEPTGITATEVAVHSTESDCWTIIEGNVYDITEYIPRHPGGGNILDTCGADGSALFRGEEASSLGGQSDHSSRAEASLEGFFLVELAQ